MPHENIDDYPKFRKQQQFVIYFVIKDFSLLEIQNLLFNARSIMSDATDKVKCVAWSPET